MKCVLCIALLSLGFGQNLFCVLFQAFALAVTIELGWQLLVAARRCLFPSRVACIAVLLVPLANGLVVRASSTSYVSIRCFVFTCVTHKCVPSPFARSSGGVPEGPTYGGGVSRQDGAFDEEV